MSGQRRILQVEGDSVTVATERAFESEAQLHTAVAAHPEVLPHEDFGIGPLVSIASELDCEGGYIDLLCVDAQGRLAVIEFKKGSENPDVRKVIAQLLDYGASLWQMDYADLEERCRRCEPGYAGSLAEYVATCLDGIDYGPIDLVAFERGVKSSLRSGSFVFVYVARDLDERTRRIMTYLAEGPRMAFFAVEVDHFQTSQASVMVPRTAFVPSWVSADDTSTGSAQQPGPSLEDANDETKALIDTMDRWAEQAGVLTRFTKASRMYHVRPREYGVSVYFGTSVEGVEFDLATFRDAGRDDVADAFITRMQRFTDRDITARKWPKLPVEAVLSRWEEAREVLLEHYFDARRQLAGERGGG